MGAVTINTKERNNEKNTTLNLFNVYGLNYQKIIHKPKLMLPTGHSSASISLLSLKVLQ
jgi:hypothetical protein